jgi:hypothetical protein
LNKFFLARADVVICYGAFVVTRSVQFASGVQILVQVDLGECVDSVRVLFAFESLDVLGRLELLPSVAVSRCVWASVAANGMPLSIIYILNDVL